MRGNFRLIVLMTLLAALLVACGGGTKPTPQEQKFGQLEINVRGTDIGLVEGDLVIAYATKGSVVVGERNPIPYTGDDTPLILEDVEAGQWDVVVSVNDKTYRAIVDVEEGERTVVSLLVSSYLQTGTLIDPDTPRNSWLEEGMVFPHATGNRWTFEYEVWQSPGPVSPDQDDVKTGDYTITVVDVVESGETVTFRRRQIEGGYSWEIPPVIYNIAADEYAYSDRVLNFSQGTAFLEGEKCTLEPGERADEYVFSCTPVRKLDAGVITYTTWSETYREGVGRTSYHWEYVAEGLHVWTGQSLKR